MNQNKLNRRAVCLLIIILIYTQSIAQSVGIGTATPNNAAMLDVQSTSKGMLIPRMSTAQRNAINPAPAGLLVFDNTTGSFWFKGGSNWIELVDTATSVWKKNGTHAYVDNTGNIGIGTNTPSNDLHIVRSTPSIGFFDAGKNHHSGNISGDSSQLILNAYRKGLGTNEAGNLLLQVGNSGIPPAVAGLVGIGTRMPDVKLHVDGGTTVGTTTGGFLQLGPSASPNMAFDQNEIQARNNGVASKLYFQTKGGGIQIGSTNAITITPTGQLYRALPLSLDADLLPIAYGRVSSAGSVLSGTGNLAVTRVDNGEYRIVVLGESNLYTNRNLYTILVTAYGGTPAKMANYEILSDNAVWVYTSKSAVHYENNGCSCSIFSYITNAAFYDYYDSDFSIIIYKR